MMKKKEIFLIFLIIAISIFIKSSNSLNNEHFSDSESYFSLRQITFFANQRTLLYNDNLSFSGKQSIILPFFYSLMGLLFLIFENVFVLKFISIVFSSLTGVVLFLIIDNLVKNKNIAFIISVCSIFIPIFLNKTTNTLTPLSLTLPLLLICLYLFSEYGKNKTKSIMYIFFLLVLCLNSFHSIIFLISIIFYIILLKAENMNITKDKKEITIFSCIFIVWINLIFLKNAIQIHGISTIWQNIPNEIILNYYSELSMISIIYFIGIIPLLFAVYGIYNRIYKTKKDDLYVYFSFTFVVFLLAILRLIQIEIGLIYLGLSFMIFCSIGVCDFIEFIKKTKSSKFLIFFLIIIISSFILTSAIPATNNIGKSIISEEKIDALHWIKENTRPDSVILGTLNEGHFISKIAQRKNVIDSNFLLATNVNEILADIKTIYTSTITTKSIENANKYNINYILLDDAKRKYNINDLPIRNSEFVEEVYSKNSIKIYKIKGVVEKYDT